MLIYFATQQHRYTINMFLETWGKSLLPKVKVTPYEHADTVRYRDVSTVIFSDYDRLSSEQRAGFGALCDELHSRGIRVLNHPLHSARRLELLTLLHKEGINSFAAYTVKDAEQAKYPLFMRFANEHSGPQTPLLYTPEELKFAIDAGRKKNVALEDMLVVEYCSTVGTEGMYRKYSAFCIDGEIVPRHLLVSSQQWALRDVDMITPEIVADERAYLEQNPHQEQLRPIFDLAKISYGRIDYSLLHGKPQIWEINPNPIVMQRPAKYKPEHLPTQEWFAPRMIRVFEKLLKRP